MAPLEGRGDCATHEERRFVQTPRAECPSDPDFSPYESLGDWSKRWAAVALGRTGAWPVATRARCGRPAGGTAWRARRADAGRVTRRAIRR
jgi:hypothetical protein